MVIRYCLSTLVLMIGLLSFVGIANAGPEGTYDIVGSDPGRSGEYRGTVDVRQTGDTYYVRWDIGGTIYVGTGLGAANVKGTMVMGPASPDDEVISIAYTTDGSFGLTFYVEQDDGTWQGIWTYAGSNEIGTETWVRR